MNFGINPFGAFESEEAPLHKHKKRFVFKELNTTEELFQETETTSMNELGSIQTVEEATIYQAGCGHIVGLQAHGELTSNCAFCGKWLCYRCGNLRCRRCLKIICESCAKLTDETTVYCRPCKTKVLAKRTIGKLGECIHGFLSKEI